VRVESRPALKVQCVENRGFQNQGSPMARKQVELPHDFPDRAIRDALLPA
jgi:hypothetical protein